MQNIQVAMARVWPYADAARALKLAEQGSDGMYRSWVMMLPTGKYQHPQFGDIDLSEKVLSELKRHFDAGVRGIEIALDYDHQAGEGDSAAPGWLEAVQLRPAMGDAPAGLWGCVRWTKIGLRDVQDQIYRYLSAEFKPDYTDDMTGRRYHNVLIGLTLTNRPFMKNMPAIALSQRERQRRDRELFEWAYQFAERPAGRRTSRLDDTEDELDEMGDYPFDDDTASESIHGRMRSRAMQKAQQQRAASRGMYVTADDEADDSDTMDDDTADEEYDESGELDYGTDPNGGPYGTEMQYDDDEDSGDETAQQLSRQRLRGIQRARSRRSGSKALTDGMRWLTGAHGIDLAELRRRNAEGDEDAAHTLQELYLQASERVGYRGHFG